MTKTEVKIGANKGDVLMNHLGKRWKFSRAVKYEDGSIFLITRSGGLCTNTSIDNINKLNNTSFSEL